MKKAILAVLLASSLFSVSAKDDAPIINVRGEVRFDYQRDWLDGTTVKNNSGFKGRYLNVLIDGTITKGLSYSWRQRLNRNHNDASFFDATDWIYIDYNINEHWALAGGKQVVNIGGWEYDRAPIDLYGCSVFWNNIPCYQIGASLTYSAGSADKLIFQFCESPFYTSDNRDMYAYNLMWQGSHGCFSALYSVNLIEYSRGHYISYVALGNRFTFGKLRLDVDIMNRASSYRHSLLKDMSVMGELSYRPGRKWNVFGKATYDVNHAENSADVTVAPGTELTMVGAGVEYYPLLRNGHTVRLHANCFYSFGKNGNPANEMQDKTLLLNVGVKWNMNFFSLKRK